MYSRDQIHQTTDTWAAFYQNTHILIKQLEQMVLKELEPGWWFYKTQDGSRVQKVRG